MIGLEIHCITMLIFKNFITNCNITCNDWGNKIQKSKKIQDGEMRLKSGAVKRDEKFGNKIFLSAKMAKSLGCTKLVLGCTEG